MAKIYSDLKFDSAELTHHCPPFALKSLRSLRHVTKEEEGKTLNVCNLGEPRTLSVILPLTRAAQKRVSLYIRIYPKTYLRFRML